MGRNEEKNTSDDSGSRVTTLVPSECYKSQINQVASHDQHEYTGVSVIG